jgi:hypothetical protein
MTRIVLSSKVDNDGVLHLDLQVGKSEANKEVRIIVESLPEEAMTQEEWRARVLSTAGKWQGPFERPEQGELEERDPLP